MDLSIHVPSFHLTYGNKHINLVYISGEAANSGSSFFFKHSFPRGPIARRPSPHVALTVFPV